MTEPATPLSDSPEAIARAFLSALDQGRWQDAAALVHPETRERFRNFWLTQLECQADKGAELVPSDTHFVSAAGLLGIDDPVAAARLTSAELLARVAESLDPATFLRDQGLASPTGELRVRRTFTESTPLAPDHVAARYRTEWMAGETGEATAGIHSLELTRTSAGWGIRDADLSGFGGGHILPPPSGEWG